MAVAGGAGVLLCASGGLRPQTAEADLLEHFDCRAGDRDFRHRRGRASAATDADSERGRDFHPNAISAAAVHLHDDRGRDDGARDRSLSRTRNAMAADSDVHVVGQFSRRLHRRTRRDGYRGGGHVRAGLVWRRGPHEVGVAARIDHGRMRGGHGYQSVRSGLVVWSGAFGRRSADSAGNCGLGAAAEDDADSVAKFANRNCSNTRRRFCCSPVSSGRLP